CQRPQTMSGRGSGCGFSGPPGSAARVADSRFLVGPRSIGSRVSSSPVFPVSALAGSSLPGGAIVSGAPAPDSIRRGAASPRLTWISASARPAYSSRLERPSHGPVPSGEQLAENGATTTPPARTDTRDTVSSV